MSKASLKSPRIIIKLIILVKESREIRKQKNEGQACVSEKDNVYESVAANTGWSAVAVSSGMAQCFLVATAVFVWEKSYICLM